MLMIGVEWDFDFIMIYLKCHSNLALPYLVFPINVLLVKLQNEFVGLFPIVSQTLYFMI